MKLTCLSEATDKMPTRPLGKTGHKVSILSLGGQGALETHQGRRKDMIDIDDKVPQYLQDILFDPQTSGGPLMAVPEKLALKLLKELHDAGVKEAAIIGEVAAGPKGRITVK